MATTTTTYAAATATAGLVLLLRFHLALAVAVTGDPLLLACGAPVPIALPDGRVFLPDSNVSISPAHASRATAITAAPASSPLYSTARAFSADATYSLPVPRSPHRHLLLRLHFPQPAQFAVAAGDLELVSDPRSASRTSTGHHRYREYLLPHRGGGLLRLRVSPRPGSLALLNAVELFPAPDALLPLPLPLIPPEGFRLAETFYRVNAGAASGEVAASSLNDSFWRLWEGDAAYLLNPAAARSVSVDPASVRYPAGAAPPYAAPAGVYARAQEMADARVGNQRFNLSWAFPVDPGFRYSVRLHLCDIVGRNSTDLVFDVYINGDAVLSSFDLSGKLGLFNAYFVDFIAAVPPGSDKILLQLGPPRLSYSKPNAILNGVEIMKLGDREAALRADDLTTAPPSKVHKKKIAIVTAEAAGGAMIITICIVGMLLFFRRRRRRKKCQFLSRQPSSSIGLHTHTGISASKVSAARIRTSSGSSLTISQIRQATNGFDESLVIGSGGFGKVYRGVLKNGATVAVKRGNPHSRQCLLEFRTEVQMLSKLRHRHLVSLIGHCHEAGEMALVYEFMAGGSLRSHLYGCPMLPPLSWKQRLEACVGAAKGLHYLHTGVSETTIIHRDVRTANILLDGALSAKVSGFGLSISAPATHEVGDDVAVEGGSSGRLDPDCLGRQRLTDKSDVYSFGVVLMEVLCAKPDVDPARPHGHASVVDRAMERRRLGELERVVDPHLAGGIGAGSLHKFAETVEKCLAEHGADRPTMGDVLWNLECALRMHEEFLSSGGEGSSSVHVGLELPSRACRAGGDGGCGIAGDVREAGVATGVFSQILDPKGR